MRQGSTEFFNISHTVLAVLNAIASGQIHRREIEDQLKISEKHCVRAIDKLAKAGLIELKPARDPGRAGRGTRLYRCYATESGFMMIMLCKKITDHRDATSIPQ